MYKVAYLLKYFHLMRHKLGRIINLRMMIVNIEISS